MESALNQSFSENPVNSAQNVDVKENLHYTIDATKEEKDIDEEEEKNLPSTDDDTKEEKDASKEEEKSSFHH